MDSYTHRLDATLAASSSFGNRSCVEEMVKKQLLDSPLLDSCSSGGDKHDEDSFQAAVKLKTDGLWEVVQSLRSASIGKEWKMEEETQNLKIKYCAGQGTPYHSYCVEGVVDAPLVHALCVMWEVPCFRKWWPHLTVPAFKVLESKWLKRLRICENLFDMRCKVPWPIATRELVVTAFEVEQPDEDAVVGCLRSVDPAAGLKETIHGYNSSDLPEPKEGVIRMDANGGFILQSITENQCYIRALIHLDLKLDYVPPWFINFIGRHVVVHGSKLYLKTVSSVKDSKVFLESLKQEPLYKRVAAQMTKKHHSLNGYHH